MKKLRYVSPRIKVTVNLEKREDLGGVIARLRNLDMFLSGDSSLGGVMIDFAPDDAGDQVPDITYQQAHGLTE